jgi:hypothetical protein
MRSITMVSASSTVGRAKAPLSERFSRVTACENVWTSAAKDALLCVSAGVTHSPGDALRARLATCGAGGCERQFRRREPVEPGTMSTLSIERSQNPKSAPIRERVYGGLSKAITRKLEETERHLRLHESIAWGCWYVSIRLEDRACPSSRGSLRGIGLPANHGGGSDVTNGG